LNAPLPVQFVLVPGQIGEPLSGAVVGRTRDVSGEGLCLETNAVIRDRLHVLAEAMGSEKRLLLAIEISDRENPLEVLGQVIWYDLAPEDSDFRFRAGVLFTEMGEEIRKRWRDFFSSVKKKRFL